MRNRNSGDVLKRKHDVTVNFCAFTRMSDGYYNRSEYKRNPGNYKLFSEIDRKCSRQ